MELQEQNKEEMHMELQEKKQRNVVGKLIRKSQKLKGI